MLQMRDSGSECDEENGDGEEVRGQSESGSEW